MGKFGLARPLLRLMEVAGNVKAIYTFTVLLTLKGAPCILTSGQT